MASLFSSPSVLALLCFMFATSAFAQQDERVFKHPLTDMPMYADDVETLVHFPSYEETKFPLGEPITVLCHFRNEGPSMYNISAIMGSLNSPFQFSHHYQNYSYKPFGTVVKPGEEISLKYSFTAHPELEPSDYQLAVTVFYDSDSETFSTTYFNETVELYLPDIEINAETISSLLMAGFAVLLVILVTYVAMFPESKFAASILAKASSAISGTGSSNSGRSPSPKKSSRKQVPVEEDNDTWQEVESRRQKREKGKKKQAQQ